MAETTTSGAVATSEPNRKAKITLYWLEKSRSHRILWLLEELKLDYELKVYKRGSDMQAPAEAKEVHPLGKFPIVSIQGPNNTQPKVLAESGLIVEYLADHFGKQLIPQRYPAGKEDEIGGETEEWMRYRYLMHYAEGSLMSLMVVALIVGQIKNASVPFFIKPITKTIAGRVDEGYLNKNFASHMNFLENQLATSPGGEFFCGSNLSAADILMIFPLEAGTKRAGITAEKYPKLSAYIERIHKRDAYQRAVKKVEEATGEKFDMALG